MDFWQEIGKLAGKTLRTLDQGKPFDIVTVGDSEVMILLHSTGRFRKIRREPLQKAWDELIGNGVLTRTDIRDKYTDFHPAYVASILAAMPVVEHSIRPITLRVQKTR